MSNVSVSKQARTALKADTKSRSLVPSPSRSLDGALQGKSPKKLVTGQDTTMTVDSFVNFAQNFGVGGGDNALSSASYGFNPITRNRTLLEWIHRGSWLGGVAVDVVANDMTRAGIDIKGKLPPKAGETIKESMRSLKIWQKINGTIRWDRLYGGCIAVYLVEGQRMDTPLRLETISKGQFKGLVVLDRWMIQPSLSNLVSEFGPNLGLPKFYDVVADSPALRGERIHYTRIIRMDGVELPYWQRLTENLWGTSIIERLYDRMIAFDSATTGAAQLVYKAYIRTYKIEGLREMIGTNNVAAMGTFAYLDFMRRFQGVEGITLLDSKDEMEAMGTNAFSGLSDALNHFAQQLAGALQIPLVRLFGMSPSGFNVGDTDMQLYYDKILQDQNDKLLDDMTRVTRAVAAGEGIRLPDGFSIQFRSLWQLEEKEKSDIITSIVGAVVQANESGLVSDKVAMQELRQAADITGVFSNITDKDINAADEVPAPSAEEVMGGEGEEPGTDDPKKEDKPKKPDVKKPEKPKTKTKDSNKVVADIHFFHDLQVVIENPRGSLRSGRDWVVAMPNAYGYFMGTVGNDGDNVDCFVGDNTQSQHVWLIDQNNPDTGAFDEHKVLLGYLDMASALADYNAAYSDGRTWDRIGSISKLTMDQFKKWLDSYKRPGNMP